MKRILIESLSRKVVYIENYIVEGWNGEWVAKKTPTDNYPVYISPFAIKSEPILYDIDESELTEDILQYPNKYLYTEDGEFIIDPRIAQDLENLGNSI